MLHWRSLTGVEKAVEMLHDAFEKELRIMVVGISMPMVRPVPR